MSFSVTRKPHIAVIGHLAGPVLYGAERSLLDVVAAVDRRKYRVSCVLPAHNDGYVKALASHADEIVVFAYEWWKGAPQGDSVAVGQFEEIFRRKESDLVHVNTVTLFDPLLAARNVGVPSILHARELLFNNPELCRQLVFDRTTTACDQRFRCSEFRRHAPGLLQGRPQFPPVRLRRSQCVRHCQRCRTRTTEGWHHQQQRSTQGHRAVRSNGDRGGAAGWELSSA